MDNKVLYLKYLFILISNILVYILCNFYFDTYKYIVMILITVGVDMFICYYKKKSEFKFYLDIICNFIVGLFLLVFIKNQYDYIGALFSLFLANNVVFMRSRINDKFLKKLLQYFLIFLYSVVCIFINVFIFVKIH